jgi:hypothetical protein
MEGKSIKRLFGIPLDYLFLNLILVVLIKVVNSDVLLLFQVTINFRFPSSNKCSVDLIILISLSNFFVMEILSALEYKPIESSILPHLDLSLVRSTLTLMDSAHVTSKALSILEVLPALRASMSIVIFWLEDKTLAFLYSLGQTI